MATILKKQREQMSKAELDKDIKLQQKRIDSNKEKMDKAPSYLKDIANELGSMGNKRIKESKDEAVKIKESKDEAVKIRKENSRAQYNHERDAGDPNALNMSFEEWKKL